VSLRQAPLVRAGVSLNVASGGNGPPVLLLHGFPDRWAMWTAQVEALLGAGFRVIAPDLRGFGGSDRPSGVESYRMRVVVADVIAILDACGADECSVVGHDWGAGLAWQVALRHPERVSRLAALSVGHPGASGAAGFEQRRLSWYMLWFLFPGVAEQMLPRDDWAFFRQWANESPDLERQIADLSRPGALVAGLNWYRANIRPETYVAAELAHTAAVRVQCPTMGVWSTNDSYLGERQMTASADFVDGPWRYERVSAGHWLPSEAPDVVSHLLLEFLS
jgi:pimeloyl-ACP methyl ester carboxylesterase